MASPRIISRLLRFLVVLISSAVILTSLIVVSLKWINPPSSAFILHASLRHQVKAPVWTDWNSISSWLPLAIIAGEDQRFPEHLGFDLREIKNALTNRLQGGQLRGASTITQQLAKNLFLWSGRSWWRKGLEAYFTVLLEIFLPKKRILELYMNIAEFGPFLFSAEQAARTYFMKPAARLNLDEACLLASVLPSPRKFNLKQPNKLLLRKKNHIKDQIRALGGKSYLQSI